MEQNIVLQFIKTSKYFILSFPELNVNYDANNDFNAI